jgi:quercetin dioxygenase-like cupin family protein
MTGQYSRRRFLGTATAFRLLGRVAREYLVLVDFLMGEVAVWESVKSHRVRTPSYPRIRVLGLLLAAAVAVLPVAALAQDPAPGPVPRAQSTFEIGSLPVPAEIVQAVLDFPPGAVAPPHVNGGAAYVTILAGELTIEGPEGVQTYRAGDTLMEVPGQVYAAANTGAATASLIVTHLIPRGAPVTTVVTR